ncbi:hypothetical protein ACOMHN_046711 [Nucella lapillus]
MQTSTTVSCVAVLLACLLAQPTEAQREGAELYCALECQLYGESFSCDCDDLTLGRDLAPAASKRGGAFPFRYGKRDLGVKRQMPFRYGKRSLGMMTRGDLWDGNLAPISDFSSAGSLDKRQFRYGKRSAPVATAFDFQSQNARSLDKPQFHYRKRSAPSSVADLLGYNVPNARSLDKRQFRYGKRSAPVATAFDFQSQNARSLDKPQFHYRKRSAPSSVADLLGYNVPNASALKASSSEKQ